jgi:hypothetical protein
MKLNTSTRGLLLLAAVFIAQTASAFYDSNLGRWTNRDPIEEEGGINLYTFVENHPVSGIDPFGLAEVTKTGDGFVIEVGKCEIVRHIGHGNRKGWPKFFFPKKSLVDVQPLPGSSGAMRAISIKEFPRRVGL